MKRLALAVLLIILAAGPARATTSYDLADYWMVTPGQWVVLQDDSGNSTRLTVAQNGDDRKLEFRSILPDSSETVDRRFDQTLTDSSLFWTGEYNFRDGDSVWTPAVSLPRVVEVGQMFHFSIQEQLLVSLYPQYITVLIESDDYSITTSAGTFKHCLKIVVNQIDFNSITTDVYFLARGIGVVRHIYSGSYEDGPTNIPFGSAWDVTKYGSD